MSSKLASGDSQRCRIVLLSSWSEARDILGALGHVRSWVFRGQGDAAWPLCTSLERVASHVRQGLDLKTIEEVALAEFQQRAHHYLRGSAPENDLEWFALMQHHGTPTRLLDWTRSPYVASYFAVEDAREFCAVWALDYRWCLERGTAALRAAKLLKPEDDVNEWSDEYQAAVLESGIGGVFPVEPFRKNERLGVQQGCFAFPGDPARSFVDNLLAFGAQDTSRRLVKFVIPGSLRAEALEDLNLMNINRTTLYPGIDGFAQAIKYRLQAAANPDYSLAKYLSRVDELFSQE